MFFGSGTFAVPILEALIARPEVELVGVVSAPDRAVGRTREPRPTPVTARAVELDLPMLRPARIRDAPAIEQIAALRPEVGILADYGQIVPQAILDLPEHGILNLHPSLLPRHRGATPIPAAILAGDPTTGVSLIRMDAGLDTGPIVATDSWSLDGTETAPDLEARAALAGARLLGRTLPGWLDGSLAAYPQDPVGVTLTRPLRREDGLLARDRSTAELDRQIRAYQPWPGTFLDTAAGRLAVLAGSAAPVQPGDRPGVLVAHDDGLALVTIDGRLRLDRVQPAGGRPMSGPEFRRGRGRDLLGPRLD